MGSQASIIPPRVDEQGSGDELAMLSAPWHPGPKKMQKRKKGSSNGRPGKAYMVGEEPTFFTLNDVDDVDAYTDGSNVGL